jgi:hypothetical protein
VFLKPSLRQSFLQTYGGNQSPRPTFRTKDKPLSRLAINSICAEDALNTPTRPKTRTVGQEESTTPQTIARSRSTPEWLVDAFDMPATPKLETPMKIMNSPTRRRLADAVTRGPLDSPDYLSAFSLRYRELAARYPDSNGSFHQIANSSNET